MIVFSSEYKIVCGKSKYLDGFLKFQKEIHDVTSKEAGVVCHAKTKWKPKTISHTYIWF